MALAHYRERGWAGAEADAELSVQFAADNPSDLAGIVPLFLFAGKGDRYHEVCRQLLERRSEWSGDDLRCAAALCTLDPNLPKSLAQLRELVERAVRHTPSRRPELLARIAIRLGKYQRAIEYLTSTESIDFDPIRQITLAVANHHAKRPLEARAWLEKAPRTLILDAEMYTDPNRRMEYQTLRHEAERLILAENWGSPLPSVTLVNPEVMQGPSGVETQP